MEAAADVGGYAAEQYTSLKVHPSELPQAAKTEGQLQQGLPLVELKLLQQA